MIVQFFPSIAGVKILSPWLKQRPRRLDCIARLTRSLTHSEAERLERTLDVKVEGDRLRYSCRPEELDQSEQRIQEVLRRIPPQLEKRSRGRRRGRRLQ